MIDLPVRHFQGRDGAKLAYREAGEGRALVLIHGYFSTATVNWVHYGHVSTIAARGYRVIMPDLRGHGDSAKPHDAANAGARRDPTPRDRVRDGVGRDRPHRRAQRLFPVGAQDSDNGSAEVLAAALQDGRYAVVPGNHMSAVTRPELGAAIADFLGA
jgi:hypothetical protein